MSENTVDNNAERTFERERQRFEDVQGFLNANGEASARARNLIVILIVASVLTGVAVLNSLQNSWMSLRFDKMRNVSDQYLIGYVGDYPILKPGVSEEEYKIAVDLYQRRYLAFTSNASGALVDNRYYVHVPFFGLSFDVNDLGMLAGVGLVSILLLLRFSAGTELENLKLSFRETYRLKCFQEFYRLAAMRQVLTIPRLPERRVRLLERWLAKPVYFIPCAVYLWMLIHDWLTTAIGNSLDPKRMCILVRCEFVFLAAIIWLGYGCFKRSRALDSTWDEWWLVYNGAPPSPSDVIQALPKVADPVQLGQREPISLTLRTLFKLRALKPRNLSLKSDTSTRRNG